LTAGVTDPVRRFRDPPKTRSVSDKWPAGCACPETHARGDADGNYRIGRLFFQRSAAQRHKARRSSQFKLR